MRESRDAPPTVARRASGSRIGTSRRPARRNRQRPLHGNPARALVSYNAMQKYLYLPQLDLYAERLGASTPSYLWPFSQALAATMSLAHVRTQGAKASFVMGAQLHGLSAYLTTVPPVATASIQSLASIPHFAASVSSASAPPRSFYDDNDWVGIELARLYEFTHDETALALAERIMAFEQAGWSGSPQSPCPGGIPHALAQGATQRSTISTAPAAELAAQLYRITGDAAYLQFAQAAYGWVHQCLLLTSGLYADHIEHSGELNPEVWSYTQGVMIGAGALLYQATGNQSYLDESYLSAQAALGYFSLEALGSEGAPAPAFASIFFRNLLYLEWILRSNAGRQLAQEYVNWAWEGLRQPSGLFLSAEGKGISLLGQAAIVQVYALLSTNPATYF
jgi:Glycosyl hydrolase family 76